MPLLSMNPLQFAKNHLKSMPLRRKLAFIAITITGLTLFASNITLISLEYYLNRQDIHTKLDVLSQVIASHTANALTSQDFATLQINLNSLEHDSSIIRGCIYNAEQQLISSYPENNPLCPSFLSELISFSRTPLSQLTPIHILNKEIGSLYIEANQTSLNNRIQQFLYYLSAILLGSIFLASLLGGWLQSIVINPLKKLGMTLHDIMQKKDYSIRAEKNSHDELGDLTDLINGLLRTIEFENHSLKSITERFRKLASLSPVGIFQTDKNLNFIYVNQRWRDIHGISAEIPLLDHWLERFSPEKRQEMDSALANLIDKQESLHFESELKLPNHTQAWIQIRISTLHDNQGDLLGYIGAVSDITELKEAQLKMEILALYDPLTGLANRRLFLDRLEKAVISVQRTNSSMALMFLDLDQFKRVNDTLGHDAGDLLLVEVAHRLRANVRESDTISRIGGDEFTILLTDVHHASDVVIVAEKILAALSKPMYLKGQELHTSVSIGITLTPSDSSSVNTLMKNADLALYRAKELGRNNFQFFSEELNRSVLEHLEIEKELNEALELDQFYLVFQPKVNLADLKIRSMESLIRWKHPKKGLIEPNKFIPIAEETGQILAIGRWVLEKSCQMTKELLSEKILPEDGTVAVNLSARQFTDPELLQNIQTALAKSQLPAHCLTLEITESILMQDVENAITTMQQIKDLGIHLVIDDFGTGYSSLAYIKRFPIDGLKVDRSFVTDIPEDQNDMAITAAVIAMAHKLNISTVAEGVETTAQLEFLRNNFCQEGQGYLFSRPLTYDTLKEFLINYQQQF